MNKIADYPTKKCNICGKEFCVPHPTRWGYKEKISETNGGRYKYFCSWKCLRKAEQKGSEGKENMEKGATRKKPGPKPKKAEAEKPAVELVYDPSIKEEYEQELAEREARGRRIAEKLDKADRIRQEMIDGIEPLMPAALESRVIPEALFMKKEGRIALINDNASISLTAYQWFKLTEEILMAIRQLKADAPAEEEDER